MATFSVKQDNDPVMAFTMAVLHSVTTTHICHWKTDSLSQHLALGEYYDRVSDLLDSFVESFQGKYGVLTKFTSGYEAPNSSPPVLYLLELRSLVESYRRMTGFPEDTELQNLVDEIVALLDVTIFKLQRLK